MAPRRGAPRARAPWQRVAPALAGAILPALATAAPQRAPSDRSGVRERWAAPGRDREEAVARAHPRVEHLTPWAHPVVDGDCGAPPTQRGLTALRYPRGALAPVQAAVCEGPPLVGVATRAAWPPGHGRRPSGSAEWRECTRPRARHSSACRRASPVRGLPAADRTALG
jgi:hypothetical protein